MAAGTTASLKFSFSRPTRPPDAGGLAAIPLFTVAGAESFQRMSGEEQLGWSRRACLRSQRPRTFCWVAKLEGEPSSYFCTLRWRLVIVGRVYAEPFLMFSRTFFGDCLGLRAAACFYVTDTSMYAAVATPFSCWRRRFRFSMRHFCFIFCFSVL